MSVWTRMIDKKLLQKYFMKHPHENLAVFVDKYVIFRRGFGLHHTIGYFFKQKINTILACLWRCFLRMTRRAKSKKESDRGIYVRHFKKIPMADMDIVLPEKKNPSLTPMDWVKFLVSAIIGLVTVVGSLNKSKPNIKVLAPILTAVIGFCAKTYFSFQQNFTAYQNLITRSMYESQLDSGRGTLLHLCDEVIQQEVKEVIISFFILMEQGKATRQDLDKRCEELIKQEFGVTCNFDVDDAVQKLEKLGIVTQDANGRYDCSDLKSANDIIGTTTEEVVLKARQGAVTPRHAMQASDCFM